MRQYAFYGAVVWLLLTGFAGCAGSPAAMRPLLDDVSTPPRDDGLGGNPPPEIRAPHENRPIVRVIKGEAVESKDAARRLMSLQPEAFPEGMQTTLYSLILRDVQVREIAELLTEISGYNVVASHHAAGHRITIYLKNLNLRSALESICRLHNIWFREGEGIITLMTREEYVRDIEVRQSDQTRAFYIRYTNAADMAKLIQAAMGSEVHLAVIEDEKIYGHIHPEEAAEVGRGTPQHPELMDRQQTGSTDAVPVPLDKTAPPGPEAKAKGMENNRPLLAILTVFKRNNCIVARSLDGGLLNEMSRIIEALDTPTSQVLLEIKILQLNLNDGFESFFQIKYGDSGTTDVTGDYAVGLGLGGSTTISANTLDLVLDTEKLDARIRYFQSQGRAEIVATPFLMAANNSKVAFFVGEETPLRDDVTTTTTPIGEQGDTMTTFEVEIVREELGTDVEMTTFINEDGTVTLDFDAEISNPLLQYSSVTLVNEKTGDTVEFPLDAKSTTELKSILTARSGQSIAIGGIIKESMDINEKKVPLLGDIPYLGFLFREINNEKRKTETVIVLTPHVIAHPLKGSSVSDEFLRRRSSRVQVLDGMGNGGLEQEASFP